MRAVVMIPLNFQGQRRKPDDIIEASNPPEDEEISRLARFGFARILEDVHTADMNSEPAQRGYKRRA